VPDSDPPVGASAVAGVTHRQSPISVNDTVQHLVTEVERAGAKIFAVIDQSEEARQAGQSLRETRLVIFGSPAAGTALMRSVPVAALDLPLKILVWADDAGQVWMTFLSADWLAQRYGLAVDLAKPLHAADALSDRVSSASS
jgi:uncharacterized protein (DUF302 family)